MLQIKSPRKPATQQRIHFIFSTTSIASGIHINTIAENKLYVPKVITVFIELKVHLSKQ